MQHHFEVEIAEKFGVLEAVIIDHLYFWIRKNEANNKNYYDGDYWTFNSIRAFSELIPYANSRQINYALNKLITAGVIKTGNYNKVGYDRTLWYAFTDYGKSILQNCKMEDTNLQNRTYKNVKPIPYKNTDKKQDKIYKRVQDAYNNTCQTMPRCTVLSPQRKKLIDARLKDYSIDQIEDVFRIANKSDFLSGRSKKWTGCNIDWLLRPNNFIKVIEKTYNNNGSKKIK